MEPRLKISCDNCAPTHLIIHLWHYVESLCQRGRHNAGWHFTWYKVWMTQTGSNVYSLPSISASASGGPGPAISRVERGLNETDRPIDSKGTDPFPAHCSLTRCTCSLQRRTTYEVLVCGCLILPHRLWALTIHRQYEGRSCAFHNWWKTPAAAASLAPVWTDWSASDKTLKCIKNPHHSPLLKRAWGNIIFFGGGIGFLATVFSRVTPLKHRAYYALNFPCRKHDLTSSHSEAASVWTCPEHAVHTELCLHEQVCKAATTRTIRPLPVGVGAVYSKQC